MNVLTTKLCSVYISRNALVSLGRSGRSVLAGVLIAFLGLMALGVSVLIFIVLIAGKEVSRNALWCTIAFFLIGLFCVRITWRLFIGQTDREDGGLFSPLVLRIAGAIFVLMPLMLFLVKS